MSYPNLTDDELLRIVYAERMHDPLALELADRLETALDHLAETIHPSTNPNC